MRNTQRQTADKYGFVGSLIPVQPEVALRCLKSDRLSLRVVKVVGRGIYYLNVPYSGQRAAGRKE
ncbi:MAG: hypothetical protein VR66_17070 [Peptococcaceae bacterium BRH_c23]|nr:MAG: hypothetical protein VR66_17070 [Peptococcaceae bacterium BRH_c23]KJS82628.1 MAG: hypothetical protein JL57_23995 [Desulfosporosinus sp. BICA1-9]